LTTEVWDQYVGDITALEQERQAIAAAGSAALALVQKQIAEMERAFEDRAQPILDAIEADLDGSASADDYEWPEPEEGLEHDDPLFDSTRSYVEQVARYHEHQGKEPELILARDRMIDRVCIHCRTTFSCAAGTARLFCSKDCKLTSRRGKREVKVYNVSCSECGNSFTAKKAHARVCGGTCQARLRVRRAKEEARLLPNLVGRPPMHRGPGGMSTRDMGQRI
jgi:hypothetical protein